MDWIWNPKDLNSSSCTSAVCYRPKSGTASANNSAWNSNLRDEPTAAALLPEGTFKTWHTRRPKSCMARKIDDLSGTGVPWRTIIYIYIHTYAHINMDHDEEVVCDFGCPT